MRSPKIVTALGATFLWQVGYAVLFAYIAPFLLAVTSMSERQVSGALFAFGIATLIGSKFGGFLTDRIGLPKSLVGGMVVHVISLVMLSTIAGSPLMTTALLMLWAISAWSSGPGLQFNLVLLAPEASGIMLSLYQSVLQLSIAAAADIGGIAAQHSMLAVSWIGAASVAPAAIVAAVSFRLAHSPAHRIAT